MYHKLPREKLPLLSHELEGMRGGGQEPTMQFVVANAKWLLCIYVMLVTQTLVPLRAVELKFLASPSP